MRDAAKTGKCAYKEKAVGVCQRAQYRRELCKDHFQKYVKVHLRKLIRSVYDGPEGAFGAIDFAGTGFVS